MFVLNSDITIGNFRFSGVNEVKVTRSMHNFTDTAIIKIPRKGMVLKGKDIRQVTVPEIINDDDKVSISLGYNGEMQTEFEGFVVRRNIDTPMEIECEGYVRQLRQKVDITKKYKKTSAKELLELIASKTEIKVHIADDLPLEQVEFTHANGIDICNKIQELSQRTLTIFFINPRELWCGFTYTPYTTGSNPCNNGEASYKIGFNCLKDNKLKERIPSEPVQIVFGNTEVTGARIVTKSKNESAIRKEKINFNNISDKASLVKMANELQYKKNYKGYEGAITGFLQPYCQPGFAATIIDPFYDKRNGKYMVESTSVTFGMSGARREIELGPVIGFNPDK